MSGPGSLRTRDARTSTDKHKTDSMGVLSFRSAADPIARSSSTDDTKLGRRKGSSSEIDRNVCLISDHERVITNSTSDSIYQWIISNSFVADILSMGGIISNISDLAIVISAEEVLSWTNEAVEIHKEKIP